MVMLKDRIIEPSHVVDIKAIPGLNNIAYDDTHGLRLGALTRIADIVDSAIIKQHYPVLSKAAGALGSPQVRNKATIGGNICRSSPSADTLPALMIFDAILTIAGSEGERRVPIEEFFTGPGRNVLNNEILTEITLSPTTGKCGTAFRKITRVSEDLAKVNCAVKLSLTGDRCDHAKIVFGAVAATPVRAKNVEQVLEGQKITDQLIEQAAARVKEDIAPIDDVRSTADYRYRVSQVMVKRLLKEAFEECGSK